MEFLLIILAIFWVGIPILAKNSQKKAKEEAERLRAARANASQAASTSASQRVQQPMRTAPLTPNMRAPMQAASEGTASEEGNFSGSMPGTSRKSATFNVQEAKSTLTEKDTSITHTVTVSSESGHAHEETSASGIAENCPPEKTPAKQGATPVTYTGGTAFVWSVEAARNGLVMAEILGPCLANRD